MALENTDFWKWYKATYQGPDGDFPGIPSWHKYDMFESWCAACAYADAKNKANNCRESASVSKETMDYVLKRVSKTLTSDGDWIKWTHYDDGTDDVKVEKSQAYKEGYVAYGRHAIDDCPYDEGHEGYREWIDGYQDASIEDILNEKEE